MRQHRQAPSSAIPARWRSRTRSSQRMSRARVAVRVRDSSPARCGRAALAGIARAAGSATHDSRASAVPRRHSHSPLAEVKLCDAGSSQPTSTTVPRTYPNVPTGKRPRGIFTRHPPTPRAERDCLKAGHRVRGHGCEGGSALRFSCEACESGVRSAVVCAWCLLGWA